MKCSFCATDIPEGTGKLLVKSDGTLLYFCSGKCEKNSKIRDNKRVKWTGRYKKEKDRRLKSKTSGK